MKWAIVALALGLAACGGSTQELTVISPGDATWPLNPDKWSATSNDLDAAPVNAPVFAADHVR